MVLVAPRLGTPRLATPRYSATRGHSVLRQHGSPLKRSVHAVAAGLTPTGGLLSVPRRRPLPRRTAGATVGVRSFRAVSEPPLRAAIHRGLSVGPPQRILQHHDDIEAEYASAMSDLTLRSASATVQDADDQYYSSRARDRALLGSADAAVNDDYGLNDITIKSRIVPSHLPPAPRLYNPTLSHISQPQTPHTALRPPPVTTHPVSTPTKHPEFTDLPVRNKSLTMWFADKLTEHNNTFPRERLSKWSSLPQVCSHQSNILFPYESPRQSPTKIVYSYNGDNSLDIDEPAQYLTPRKRRRRKKQKRREMLKRWRRRRKANRLRSFGDTSDSDFSDEVIPSSDDDSLYPSDNEVALRDYYSSHIPYEPQMPYPTSRRFISESPHTLPVTYEIPEISDDVSDLSPSVTNRYDVVPHTAYEPIDIDLNDSSFHLTTLASRYLPKACAIYANYTPDVPVEPTIARCIKSSFKPELRSIDVYDSPLRSEDRVAILDFKVPLGRSRYDDISLSAPVAISFRDSDNFIDNFLATRREFRDHILRGLDMPTSSSRYSGISNYQGNGDNDLHNRYRPLPRISYYRRPELDLDSDSYSTISRPSSRWREYSLDRPRYTLKSKYDDEDNDTEDTEISVSNRRALELPLVPYSSNSRRSTPVLAIAAPSNAKRDFVFSDNTKEAGEGASTTMDRIKLKANATITPAASRRIVSRTTVTSSPNTQVDIDADYVSPLYPEYDIEESSTEGTVRHKASPTTKPGSKLGSRAVGARARVNLKRSQLGNRVNQDRAVRAKTAAPEVVVAPRAMSLPPVPVTAPRLKQSLFAPKTEQISQYENIMMQFVPSSPKTEKARYQRKALSRQAREGASYGDPIRGRAAAIAVNRGRRFRPLRDYRTPLHPIYYDESESAKRKSPTASARRRVLSSKTVRHYPPVRRAETPAVTIISEPRTLIRSKKYLYMTEEAPKAALLAPTIEIESRRRKKPRSPYGAAKMRELDMISRESETAGLHASAPSARRRSDRKAIRTEEGFTKPANVMSWQHRIETKIDPDDGIYVPAVVHKLKDRLRDVQDKMDVHRLMLDRYVDADLKPVTVMANSSIRDFSTTRGYMLDDIIDSSKWKRPKAQNRKWRQNGGEKPSKVSERRREIRKAICKGRQDPTYFH